MQTRELLRRNLFRAIETRNIDLARTAILTDKEIVHPVHWDEPIKQEGPLWNAIKTGHEEMIQLLINNGANVNQKLYLHFIAYLPVAQQTILRIAEILIENGADVNLFHHGEFLQYPLNMAIMAGHMDYIKLLLKKGAVAHGHLWMNYFPMVSILRAPITVQVDILKLLIENGFDPLHVDGQSDLNHLGVALVHAEDHPNKVDLEGVKNVLFGAGITIEPCVLPVLRYCHKTISIAFLIDNGADINRTYRGKKDKEYMPLGLVSFWNKTNFVEYLIYRGADLNAKSADGLTPLHLACMGRCERTIAMLIDDVASISIKDKNGTTPFAILNPVGYDVKDRRCLYLMVMEIAKAKFLKDRVVLQSDMNLITSRVELSLCFKSCFDELHRMSSFKFYKDYTYMSVLQMFGKIDELLRLARNQEFVSKFLQHLSFPHYGEKVRKVVNFAIEIQKSDNVEKVELQIRKDLGHSIGKAFIDIMKNRSAGNDSSVPEN